MNDTWKLLKNHYHLDPVQDTLFKHDHHVCFIFDMDKQPVLFHVLSGNPTMIGLPAATTIPFETILSAIQEDNALAEIEGKESFVKETRKKIMRMKEEMHLYLPFKKDHQTVWCSVGLEFIKNTKSKRLVLGRVNRVTDVVPKAIEYYQKTFQDSLTRLFTRETLRLHLSYIKHYQGKYGLYIDIDNFKSVNDVYGHRRGDNLLKCIADSFINHWEKDVIYYRLGGDEFFVYVDGHTEQQVIARAKQLIHTFETVVCDGMTYDISASIGIVKITEETVDYTTLLDIGDQAMYQSKAKGRGQITIYQKK